MLSVSEQLAQRLPDLALPVNAVTASMLERMISGRRIPHAIVIEGDDKTKNTRLATIIAQAWLCACEQPLGGECRPCLTLGTGGGHADFEIVSAVSASGAIPVDEIRALHLKAGRAPTEADGMAFLLENGDLMQRQAQNAFLKLFEEPPDGVLMMLTCRSRMKLLETIRSRACILRVEWSETQEETVDEAEKERRSAQAELESFAERFALALIAKDDADALILSARFSPSAPAQNAAARRDFIELTGLLAELLRKAMLLAAGAGSVLKAPCEAAQRLSSNVPPERLQMMLDILPELERAATNNAAMSLVTAAACVKLRTAAGL